MENIAGILFVVALLIIAPILGVVAFFRTLRLDRELKDLRAGAAMRSDLPAERFVAEAESAPAAPASIEAEPVAAAVDSYSLAESEPAPTTDIESVIGGKWLNIIGLAAVLIASAFFLKYAFDNNWIGPIGRIALGLLGGTAIVAASQPLLRRGWTYFSEGITGLGAGILYLSLFAAWNFYHLIPTEAAFGGMAAVTASLIVLALRRDSQRLGVLALLGGYVTPLLVSSGHDAQIQLFSYLAVLNAGLLWMALARDWRTLPTSFLFTLAYGAIWYDQFYNPSKLAPSLIFASIFFVEFAVLPAIQARRSGQLRADAVALTLLNAGWYLTALDIMLYGSHRWLLTALVLSSAALYLVIADLAAPRAEGTRQPSARPIFGSVALTFVTVSIPIRLDGQWIAMAWAVEGAVLAWNGLRSDVSWLRTAGLIVLAAVAVDLLVFPIPAGQAFLNGRFLTFAVLVVALAVTAALARRYAGVLGTAERLSFGVVEVTANLYAVWALSVDTWQALAPNLAAGAGASPLQQQFGISLLWAVYAAALAMVGFQRNSSLARWQAVVLFALVLLTAPYFEFAAETQIRQAFVNVRFMTCVVLFAALGLTLLLSRRHEAKLSPAEVSVFKVFGVALNVFAVWALSVEVWQSNGASTGWTAAQQLGLSLVWTLYAAVLIGIGIRRDSALVRWQALTLFGFVILKAVVFDLSLLAIGYRIASFMALGIILIGASFLYQRRLFGRRGQVKS